MIKKMSVVAVLRGTQYLNRMATTGSDGRRGRMDRLVQANWLKCAPGRVRPTISHVLGISKAPLNRSTPREQAARPHLRAIEMCGSRGPSVQCPSHAAFFFAIYKHLAIYTHI